MFQLRSRALGVSVMALVSCASPSKPADAPKPEKTSGATEPAPVPSEPDAAVIEAVAPRATIPEHIPARPFVPLEEMEALKQSSCETVLASVRAKGRLEVSVDLRVDARYRNDYDPNVRVDWADRADALSKKLIRRIERELPKGSVTNRVRLGLNDGVGSSTWSFNVDAHALQWLCSDYDVMGVQEPLRMELFTKP